MADWQIASCAQSRGNEPHRMDGYIWKPVTELIEWNKTTVQNLMVNTGRYTYRLGITQSKSRPRKQMHKQCICICNQKKQNRPRNPELEPVMVGCLHRSLGTNKPSQPMDA